LSNAGIGVCGRTNGRKALHVPMRRRERKMQGSHQSLWRPQHVQHLPPSDHGIDASNREGACIRCVDGIRGRHRRPNRFFLLRRHTVINVTSPYSQQPRSPKQPFCSTRPTPVIPLCAHPSHCTTFFGVPRADIDASCLSKGLLPPLHRPRLKPAPCNCARLRHSSAP